MLDNIKAAVAIYICVYIHLFQSKFYINPEQQEKSLHFSEFDQTKEKNVCVFDEKSLNFINWNKHKSQISITFST